MEDIELAPPTQKPAKAKAEPKAEQKVEAPAEWPKFMKSGTPFSYADPETGLRYQPHNPVRVDAAPKEGSWLDCQMKAGYITQA